MGRSLQLGFERLQQTALLTAQNAELDAGSRALEAFALLTRDLTFSEDAYDLMRRAQEVTLSLLPAGYALYFEPDGDRWRLRAQTGDLGSAALQAVADAGLPYQEAHNLLRPWTTLTPYYQDQYDEATDNLNDLVAHLGASATLPVLVAGRAVGVFAVVLFRCPSSMDARRPGRAGECGALAGPGAGAQPGHPSVAGGTRCAGGVHRLHRSRRDRNRRAEPQRQAFEVLRTRFSDTSTSVYYEVNGDTFYARSWSADIDDQPQLLAALQGGTPITTPLFAEAVVTGEAAFTGHWDPEREQIAHTEADGAAAVYPLRVGGQLRAFLGLGLRQQRHWTERGRGGAAGRWP